MKLYVMTITFFDENNGTFVAGVYDNYEKAKNAFFQYAEDCEAETKVTAIPRNDYFYGQLIENGITYADCLLNTTYLNEDFPMGF